MRRIAARTAIRVFAVFVLVLGLVAGVYVGLTHQARQQAVKNAAAAPSFGDERRDLPEERRASRDWDRKRRAAEAERAAREEAQRKADAASRAAAERAAGRAPAPPAGPPGAPVGPIPESCQVFSGNRQIGCTLMLEWGYGLDQFPCLEKLWTRESGWNERASNRSSGAYGIPQALPGNKMAKYGSDWQTNPATQIRWGLDYIKGRYQTPCGAWSFFQNNGWY